MNKKKLFKIAQKNVFFLLVLFFFNNVQAEQIQQSAQNIGTFGIFTDEYDWQLDSINWVKMTQKKNALTVGIANNSYNVSGGGKVGSLYLAGGYTGIMPAYGFHDDTMTDFSLSLFTGFFDIFSFKCIYFDQNFPRGFGQVSVNFLLGAVIPFSNNKLNLTLGAKNTLYFPQGSIFDILQTGFSITAEYEIANSRFIALSYTITPTFAGFDNSTDVSLIPILHRIETRYKQTWNISETLFLGLKVNIVSRLNINRTVGNWDLYVALPTALVYKIIPNKLDFFVGLELAFYYADFDYHNSEGGGNRKGSVPITGVSLGLKFEIIPRAILQLAFQFERIPIYSPVNQYAYSVKDISLSNLPSAPLAISFRLSF